MGMLKRHERLSICRSIPELRTWWTMMALPQRLHSRAAKRGPGHPSSADLHLYVQISVLVLDGWSLLPGETFATFHDNH